MRAEEDPRSRQQQLHTVRRVLLILLIVAIVLAIVGVTYRLVARAHLKKRTAADAEVTVTTVRPTLSQADSDLVLPGNVVAYMEAPIYARTSGYLQAWYTDIGARVHKGDLLALIDTPEVDRQLAQARADLQTAEANSHLAQTTNVRWQGLLARQAVSKQDADEKAGDAQAKVAAEASAGQNVQRLQDLEGFRRVVAPFDGVVTARNTDVGALINAGQSSGASLFTLADIHILRIYAQIPEPYAAALHAGLSAQVHFAEHPEQPFTAQIVRTANALDPASRTLEVELQLNNSDGELFPGAYAEIHFRLPSSHRTLRVPSNTILFRDTGLQIATVQGADTIKLKTVDQGRDFGQTLEILGGLNADDRVIVNPPDSVEDGMKVHVAAPQTAKDQKSGGGSGQTSVSNPNNASRSSKAQSPESPL
ncbi:MAG TPA: efflux RND transporter periplasmic adaptor subunit [Steroidobacteraceae bacterium]|nr:efflux RND transporter periplasmic adaptor subunit [Steroidobacteraceae bacterium]